MKKRFCIIGCQHRHISIFIQEMLDMGYECAGIYERDNVALAQSISESFNISLKYDRDELLFHSDIVGCASINNEKMDVIELCEQHGKHIMLDKPAVTCREDYKRLKKVVARGAIQIGMLLTERTQPALITLKNKMFRGEFGSIVHIGMRKPHLLSVPRRAPWFFNKRQSGGIIHDLLIHDFDLLRWLTGKEIISTSGYMAKHILPEHETFYNMASLQVKMEEHITAHLYADWHTPEASWTGGDARVFVVGTKATAELRLAGDPLCFKGSFMTMTTLNSALERVSFDNVSINITEDFINRIHGQRGLLSAADICTASEAAVEADENVEIIKSV